MVGDLFSITFSDKIRKSRIGGRDLVFYEVSQVRRIGAKCNQNLSNSERFFRAHCVRINDIGMGAAAGMSQQSRKENWELRIGNIADDATRSATGGSEKRRDKERLGKAD